VAVVPQGGNTGLVGGAVPRDAIVLSTARLGEIGPVDALAREDHVEDPLDRPSGFAA